METVKIVCNKCQSTEAIIRAKGPHIGAYCARCGKWIKWLNKAERNVTTGNEYVEAYVKTSPKDVNNDGNDEVPW